MKSRGQFLLYACVVLIMGFASSALAEDSFDLPRDVASIISSRCIKCHSGDTAEGEVRLDGLAKMSLNDRLEVLNKVQEQIIFKQMPPKAAQPLSSAEGTSMTEWVSKELRKHNASKLEDRLRRPEYGNYVDHNELFSGEYAKLKGFTYDRRWLISEFIFDAKANRIFEHTPFLTIDGKRQFVLGSNNRPVNLTNPFLLPTDSGVRYYANETLNGGHLLTMMTNAKEASAYMVHLAKRNPRYLPAIAEIMALPWEHQRLLASREEHLNNFLDRILAELYGDKHEAMLPKFVRVTVETEVLVEGEASKKAPYHAANPGPQEVELIHRTMQKHEQKGDTDEQIIEKCEREWFYFGHNERKILGRVTFLKNYMAEFRKQMIQFSSKYRPLVYKPASGTELAIITQTIRKHRNPGDRYNDIVRKCMSQWEAEFNQARIDAGPPKETLIAALVNQLFVKILERSPTDAERDQYVLLATSYIANLGNQPAIEKLIHSVLLRSEFVYRQEFGAGAADEFGRKLLLPRDAGYAIAYALTDSSPDAELVKAVEEARLNTREDYRREVLRLLGNRKQYYVVDEAVQRLQLTASFTNMPIRELRFFREFFGYPQMLAIFKDNKRFGGNYDDAKGRLVGEADQVVERILEEDKRVFERLLNTDDFYVYHSGDNESMKAASDRIRKIYDYFKDKGWEKFTLDDLAKHREFIGEVKMRGIDVNRLEPGGRYNPLVAFKTAMTSFTVRFDKGQVAAAPFDAFPGQGQSDSYTRVGLQLRAPEVAKFFNIQLDNWNYPTVQPAKSRIAKGC